MALLLGAIFLAIQMLARMSLDTQMAALAEPWLKHLLSVAVRPEELLVARILLEDGIALHVVVRQNADLLRELIEGEHVVRENVEESLLVLYMRQLFQCLWCHCQDLFAFRIIFIIILVYTTHIICNAFYLKQFITFKLYIFFLIL